MSEGSLIIVGGVTRLHLLSEQVLSLFSYTLSIPVGETFSDLHFICPPLSL